MNPFKLLNALRGSAPRFTPQECAARIRSGDAVLIDLREPNERHHGVVHRAVLLPFSDLTGARVQWKPFLAAVAGRELLLYCGAGVRSAIAARLLAVEGFRTANAGSFKELASAGWPLGPGAK